ncbi:nitrilase-related carbon-nitrogen hydrolase [Polycladidibacter hongkongensis]|uniref:nitrilase-related carbon-nitrogen hydrolase n=1 Tax=Polycladidibacter hongkongensis TaxID=1647556 RepID=UPI00082B50EF|nr:nitrilase-related carbon-nitrogen hydrolase [Pseudovibrio hongkongensis]
MANSLKVGAAQISSAIGDIAANTHKHLSWIKRAKDLNVELLIFPELSLTGHYGSETLLDCARKETDACVHELVDAAGDMTVVFGLIEEGKAAQFYNSALAIAGGKILHKHRKINIPTYGKLEEGKHYGKGQSITPFSLAENWEASLLICADLWNPALPHLAFMQDTTLLLSPVSSGVEAVGMGFDNSSGWSLAMRFYSMMYGTPSVMVNRCGVEKDLTFWGGSRITDAFGNEIAVAGDTEELITAELDYETTRRARYRLPTVRDSSLPFIADKASKILRHQ